MERYGGTGGDRIVQKTQKIKLPLDLKHLQDISIPMWMERNCRGWEDNEVSWTKIVRLWRGVDDVTSFLRDTDGLQKCV